MKKWKVILPLFVLLFIFSQIGQAAANNMIQVSVNGTKVSVKPVPIIMDGQAINTEFPSFVYSDRTLVPIRFVSESYGAEVGWDQKTKTATVTHGDKEGKFTVDSNIATINGKKVTLDKFAIPRLAKLDGKDSRTMVPLKFVTDVFGYEVGWDSTKDAPYINTNEAVVNSISLEKGSTDKNKLVIKSNKSIKYETVFIEDSNKLVIDINDSKILVNNTTSGVIDVNDGIIEKVEYSQFSSDPSITRVILTLKDKAKYNISLGNNNQNIIVSFDNEVKSATKEIINGKEAIVIHSTSQPKVNTMRLQNPERIVLDIMDSNLVGTTYSYDYDLGFIKGVRISQFGGDNNYSPNDRIVRVVLDIKEGTTDPNIKMDYDEGKIIIYPEKSFWENISYTSSGTEKIFTIVNLEDTDYLVNYNQASKLMEISIPSDKVELTEGKVSVKDGLVNELEVVKDKDNTKLLIKFAKEIEYTQLSKGIDSKVSLSVKRNGNYNSLDNLIVIDAGHGGKDPGASSVTKKREKDLNLSVSLKLNEKLEELGYNTIMTRDTDEFIDLYERARIANDSNADLFVSIHGNSHNNGSIAGVQILYCPATKSSLKEVDQHPFAKIIMEEVLNATGAVDKGIVDRPNLIVLRETKMPAVLVETGFLSNAAEEQLLFNEEYQNKIVTGIINGIQRYLETY
ncbi:N-acetylmuramoyl-L-alanine amidase family protein [Tissierella sp. MB52-C2]|uniref:N-acetylmuramoyl-L-alanine amidase family protein n=1 Tax=Tissierella sp. MB52-C2 TaxID=3070999 RepID=UPI00280C27AF|nr:N-acetylmuramoyl-L-alanine amidase family protein [Tissierella sp. MB52-C2]WMM23855.1 N-acetylmuramoyl-L-alanine amidase family protein [Tissierella sp. MB52-C2]